jgi:hypothetical protein
MLHLPPSLDPRQLLRPRRRGIASINSEVRDGIVPAADRIGHSRDYDGGVAEGPNYRTVALIIACAMFMEALDATVLATALPTMARDFGVRAAEMSVALTSYLLALGDVHPGFGGRRRSLRRAPGVPCRDRLVRARLARLRAGAEPDHDHRSRASSRALAGR